MKRRRVVLWALVGAGTALAGLAGAIIATEPWGDVDYRKIEVRAYSDAPFVALLRKYVAPDGRVDYAAWKASPSDLAALDDFVTLLANASPENRADLFPTAPSRRAYWIMAYNALVLKAVLDLWPLESVRSVRVSLTSYVKPGKGFFYDRRVVVGGRVTNLYDIENEILRKEIKDPRIHFAVNCASGSCPILRPSHWTEEDLDRAAREFINNPENVRVEDGKVRLSRIFEWYEKDFVTAGRGATILDYLLSYADRPLAQRLTEARDRRRPIRYLDYDWSLNRKRP